MTARGTFTPLHRTTRNYLARTVREPLPARVRELVERLHEAEPIRDPGDREGTQCGAQGNKRAGAHH